ncbi:CPBP family intramembrane glutamic endopeptidase [Chryseobacterium sp.]|uniref:CPBP family intramembrane glutamic endopeptidase n=1 Tax=Chryseobacterium sp. TaxID=1871047 RepID=UPI0012AA63EB|nr:CPBP family intramembrane glutamic endopeptidase [Chryseobacterium sp.]QFG53234.1 CPBP family intramembrane metalloprotease [Chryseobacterium sp.]
MINDITKTIKAFLHFLKSPRDRFSEPVNATDRYRIFTVLFFAAILFNVIVILPVLSLVDYYVLDVEHKGRLRPQTIWFMLFLAAVAAPLWEEFVFRFPLKTERNYLVLLADKIARRPLFSSFWQRNFKIIFYLVAVLFGLIHSLNFENEWNWLFILLLPILILSQSVTGLFLGYIRLRLGFIWAVIFHACFNFVLITVPYLVYQNTELINIKTANYELRIEGLFCMDSDTSSITHDKHNDKIFMIKSTNTDLQFLIEATIGQGYDVKDDELVHFYFKSEKGMTEQELINLLKKEFEISEK